jgi:hypothetical protein
VKGQIPRSRSSIWNEVLVLGLAVEDDVIAAKHGAKKHCQRVDFFLVNPALLSTKAKTTTNYS